MNIGNVRNWISNVPAISRHTGIKTENYRVTVQPYTYGKQSTINKSSNNGFSFIVKDNSTVTTSLKSLMSSDNTYTKEDAVIAQWNKQGSFNLFDVMEGKAQVPLQNPNPSAEELKQFEEILQKNGISKEIDWNNIEFDLKGIDFGKEDASYSVNGENFNRKTDYLISWYAAASYKITQNYTGEEREKQIEKLNTIYQKSLEEIAESYTNIVGDFLEKSGMNEEKENVYQSLINSTNSKASEYEKYLSENGDFLGLSNTKDAWLLEDDEYIAARLREQNVPKITSQSDKSIQSNYTLKDLEVLGEYVSSVSKLEEGMTYKMDEERIGLDFAMLAMKADTLQKSGKTSDNFNEMLSKLLNNSMNSFLNRMDYALTEKREEGIVYDSLKGFEKLDHNSVWNVYHRTMQTYKESGNAIKALIDGAEFGAEQHSNHSYKMNGTYRYRNNSLYWSNFFHSENVKNSKVQYYQKSSSTYQKYLEGWIDFENSLKGGEAVRMNVALDFDKNDISYIRKQT